MRWHHQADRITLESVHLEHVLAAVLGVADQLVPNRIDDEVELFQGNLADENWTALGDLGHIDQTISALDRQPDGFMHLDQGWTGRRAGRPGPCCPEA